MIRQILVATDGSDAALRAVDIAANMAKAFETKLTVLHVLLHGSRSEDANRLAQAEHLVRHVSQTTMPDLENVPGSMTDLFRAARNNDEMSRIVAELGERIAQQAVQRARGLGARDVDARVEMGDYAQVILKTAEDTGSDAIVMGSRGLGGLRGLLVGSVSNKVAHHAPCSVFTVR